MKIFLLIALFVTSISAQRVCGAFWRASDSLPESSEYNQGELVITLEDSSWCKGQDTVLGEGSIAYFYEMVDTSNVNDSETVSLSLDENQKAWFKSKAKLPKLLKKELRKKKKNKKFKLKKRKKNRVKPKNNF